MEMEIIADEKMNEQRQGLEELDISGSPVESQEEQVELSTREIEPTERRMATLESAPAQKRRAAIDKDSPAKRLVMNQTTRKETKSPIRRLRCSSRATPGHRAQEEQDLTTA